MDQRIADLLELPQSELLSLLAVCVAVSVGAVTWREGDVPAAALAQAVGLDMHDWWAPTAAGYFEHVSKAKTLEAPDAISCAEALSRLQAAGFVIATGAGSMT